jgi:hypothetical protein
MWLISGPFDSLEAGRVNFQSEFAPFRFVALGLSISVRDKASKDRYEICSREERASAGSESQKNIS